MSTGSTSGGRLVSVDVFRGATVVAMILVNNPGNWGAVYAPLRHAEWHGMTPTDWIFPFFLFVVGVSIVLALGRKVEAGVARGRLVPKIVRRSLVLFGLGLVLTGYPFGLFGSRTFERLLESWRIPGVLQRIALCYLLAALLFLFCRKRTLRWVTAACLLGYWALMTLVPVPGVGAPDLATQGDHLAGWLDRTLLGEHVWYYGKVYDPEGVLSTIPALATTLFGLFAGWILTRREPLSERTSRLFTYGAALALAGYAWSFAFPLNKPLWTSSYAVLTAGLAALGLGLCSRLFDAGQRPRLARPFVVYGVNAITIFVGSGLLARTLSLIKIDGTSLQSLVHSRLFASWLPPHPASLAYAVVWVLGWYAVLTVMHRRGWVLKV